MTAVLVVGALPVSHFVGSVHAAQAGLVATPAQAAAQPPPVPRPNYEAPLELQRADLPQWPYTPPPAGKTPPFVEDGTLYHVPGSAKAYTMTQINGSRSPSVDWFPDSHPPAPASVITGRPPAYRACGECHLLTGRGKSDTANLDGLSVAYMLQQLDDMKNDRRHASVRNMGVITMIPVAKAVTPEEAREAAEYFHSIPAVKSVRVVETDTVPKTFPAPHRLLAVDPSGATEPIGTRIIEIPEDFSRTELRDPISGFIAYVPVGSVHRGEVLVKTGGNGTTLACIACHGIDLKGSGDTFPPLAGRSPSALARQLYDFHTGARNGTNALMMKPVVARLSDRDIVDITAYLASLEP